MPKRKYQFWVYILSNRSHIIYIGVTNGLRKRVLQHRRQIPGTFTGRYKITRLVYFERYQYINNAIARETELKQWTRAQKIALIESMNPTWEELMPEASLTDQTFETQIPFGNDKQGKASA
jgi:putative endonuclease